MNYIKHLSGFFEKVVLDYDFNPTHISLYIAIFQVWNQNRFVNPISISRDELMRISKISSKATYHKCIKDLVKNGYIIYSPSYNPYKSSMVEILELDFYTKPITRKEAKKLKNEQVDEPVLNQHCTSNDTSTEQVYIYTNNINNTNSLNDINSESKKIEKLNFQPDFKNDFVIPSAAEGPKKKLREKKRYKPDDDIQSVSSRARHPERSRGTRDEGPPDIEEVKNYFQEKNCAPEEAERFFNYYASKGWLVGGKSKMKDWRASCNHWILNIERFNPKNRHPELVEGPKPNHLHTTNQKDYNEPL
ncbi:MAG: transcriptional regulator [Flavobacterium sp.]|nr:MAG: transcriptional regulator [Flavobacterium sp.] [Flavobacterium sp. FEMGT703F]